MRKPSTGVRLVERAPIAGRFETPVQESTVAFVPPRPSASASDVAARLGAVSLFGEMSPEQRQAYVEQSELRVYRPGEVVLSEFEPPQAFYVLLAGVARVFYTAPDGRRMMAKLFTAPSAFGEMELLVGRTRLETVDILVRAEILVTSSDVFKKTLSSSPGFSNHLLMDVCARLCVAAQNERSLAFDSARAKLAALLLSYARVFGAKVAAGVQIVREITQEELADGLGLSHKSVQRTVDEWREQGVLEKSGRYYVICDLATLQAQSSEHAPALDYSLRP